MGLETYFSSPGLPSPTRPKAFQHHIISSISWWCSKKCVLVLLGGFLEARSSQKSRLLARAGIGCARGLELLTETRLCVSFRDIAASLAKPCSGPEEEAFFCRVKTKMPMEDREGGSSVTGSLVLTEEHHTWCVLCISAVREVGVRWQQGVGKALDVQR